MTKAVFAQLNIVSSDPDRAADFFRLLGVEIPAETMWRTDSGAHHVNIPSRPPRDFSVEIDSVAFASIWNTAWSGRDDIAGKMLVGIAVPTREDVDAAYARATQAGHRGLHPPQDAFWGARFAIVEGPDGIMVGIMSPASDEMRSAPPNL